MAPSMEPSMAPHAATFRQECISMLETLMEQTTTQFKKNTTGNLIPSTSEGQYRIHYTSTGKNKEFKFLVEYYNPRTRRWSRNIHDDTSDTFLMMKQCIYDLRFSTIEIVPDKPLPVGKDAATTRAQEITPPECLRRLCCDVVAHQCIFSDSAVPGSFVVKAMISHNREINILNILKQDNPLPDPIKAYLGDIPVQHLVLDKQPRPELGQLNQYQQQMGNVNNLQSCMQFIGPPGTGKSHTISVFMEQLILHTNYDVVLLSEKNTAMTAVVEHLKKNILATSFNTSLWSAIMTFCSPQASGVVKEFYDIDQKLAIHPLYKSQAIQLKTLTNKVDEYLHQIDETFNILGGVNVYNNIQESLDAFYQLDPDQQTNWWYRHSDEHHRIVYETIEKSKRTNQPSKFKAIYSKPYNASMFGFIEEKFHATFEALQLLGKSHRNIVQCQQDLLSLQQSHHQLHQDLVSGFQHSSRIFLSTFGSFSKMTDWFNAEAVVLGTDCPTKQAKPSTKQAKPSTKQAKPPTKQAKPSTKRAKTHTKQANPPPTTRRAKASHRNVIVMIDEASTVPQYDIHTLTVLESIANITIKSLMMIGDDKQLQPFNPTTKTAQTTTTNLPSLLVNDFITIDTKYYFEQQYRIPRSIANILNQHVYHGRYRTDDSIQDCTNAVIIHNVPHYRQVPNPDNQAGAANLYYNNDEIQKVLALYRELVHASDDIFIIAPYTEQVKHLKHTFKQQGLDDSIISTIDMCQGLEADVVIFTLVLPYITRHLSNLTNGRLCVALSRQRQQLHLVCDEKALVHYTPPPVQACIDCGKILKDVIDIAVRA